MRQGRQPWSEWASNGAMGYEAVGPYPTDQRPSSFRQFWDVRGYVPKPGDPADPARLKENLRDIPPITPRQVAAQYAARRQRHAPDQPE